MFRNPQSKRRAAVVCALLAALGVFAPVYAQLDYDTYDIYQTVPGAARTLAGTIYVPQRGPDHMVYHEYWVLFPSYVYPGVGRNVDTELVSSTHLQFTSLEHFFATVPWAEGCRFVDVIAVDTGHLPGRSTSATTNGG